MFISSACTHTYTHFTIQTHTYTLKLNYQKFYLHFDIIDNLVLNWCALVAVFRSLRYSRPKNFKSLENVMKTVNIPCQNRPSIFAFQISKVICHSELICNSLTKANLDNLKRMLTKPSYRQIETEERDRESER